MNIKGGAPTPSSKLYGHLFRGRANTHIKPGETDTFSKQRILAPIALTQEPREPLKREGSGGGGEGGVGALND